MRDPIDPIKFPVEFVKYSIELYFAPLAFLCEFPAIYIKFLEEKNLI